MFQTAFVYTSVFLECSNKVATSKDTRLRMYFHGDLSVGIMCEYIYTHMWIYTHAHTHTRLCIYIWMPKKEKPSDTKSSKGS